MVVNEQKLRVELLNKQPVELISITNSLLSLGNQYRRFCYSRGNTGPYYDVKLYVEKIESGSIITDLVSVSPAIYLPFFENINSVVEFGLHLKTAYNYFRGKSEPPAKFEKVDYEDLGNIIEPIAKDVGGQFNIINSGPGSVYFNVFSTDSSEAKSLKKKINAEKRIVDKSLSGIQEQMLFYWHQANKGAANKKGDLGIIETLSDKPVKVLFDTDAIKMAMLNGHRNIFKLAFIVDVQVQTINGEPKIYKVIRVHESFLQNH
ncbi:hypothetical protein [Adhaeribacter radiodurans]|uniref:Uncharacterized protein n=1 Tax=Adhaeribacter radiodurans TaxID=2745197 RepID=A0A7L7LE52_9BACT|nr:hypothetical protein [Adhaeribacter radiodurans]QMU31118.1 hypothetical protein HUW48_25210 [Adhaeribacter radiodurans]